jgi:hypothetical protein
MGVCILCRILDSVEFCAGKRGILSKGLYISDEEVSKTSCPKTVAKMANFGLKMKNGVFVQENGIFLNKILYLAVSPSTGNTTLKLAVEIISCIKANRNEFIAYGIQVSTGSFAL